MTDFFNIIGILIKTLSKEVENRKFGDIVQGDFVDSYNNLSFKGIMGNLWVAEFCEQAEFVVKTDDDLYYDLFEVDFMIIINISIIHHLIFRFTHLRESIKKTYTI